MRTTWKTRAATAITAGILAACGVAPQTSAPTPTAMSGMDHSSMPMSNSAAPYDAQFIDSMIIHHQSAIEMAQEAQQQAQKPELKALAQNIITAQTSEIKQLQQWRKEWYPELPITGGTGMDMGDMTINTDTSTLFDQRFITAMTRHHQGAIDMAKDAQQRAEHSEVKTLAQNIIRAQEAEITQMRQWQQEWSQEN